MPPIRVYPLRVVKERLKGKEVKNVAFIQCAGSRDENHLLYCSGICCLASLKQSRYVREQYPDCDVTIFFIDIRALDRLEDFYAMVQEDEKVTFITIGTGGVTGIYYPTGVAISRMINRNFEEYGIKATVESTSGSVFNLDAVIHGDIVFGVVQSDRQFQAYNGLAEWTDRGPQTDLRSVFSIHPESITLVAVIEEIGSR